MLTFIENVKTGIILVYEIGFFCVYIIEFPPDDELSQDESALDETEDEIEDEEEEEEEEESPKKATKKRKAAAQGKEKAKVGHVVISNQSSKTQIVDSAKLKASAVEIICDPSRKEGPYRNSEKYRPWSTCALCAG